ncbi:MAG: hypothetical protein A2Y55_12980 [Actinobacteria bacterium RBG_16_68_12]|nr:MAG: hypothetical protein A2Y55_12980 [Actinobacteria bacterium RBG_16_68_12]
MIVTTDFRLVLDEAAISTVMPAGLDRPGLRRRLSTVVEDMEAVAAPAACYEAYPIERILHDRLELAGGTRIGCGPLTSVIAGAEELYVAVCTLGGALDERVRTYREGGRYLEMLLLDELGSWAVDQVRTQLYERVQTELAERGWHLSSPLSPGESAWPIREQRVIFKLLDATTIDVTLGASDLMRPLKSLSLAFGAGSQKLGAEGLTRCHFCSIRDRCRYAA